MVRVTAKIPRWPQGSRQTARGEEKSRATLALESAEETLLASRKTHTPGVFLCCPMEGCKAKFVLGQSYHRTQPKVQKVNLSLHLISRRLV
eukprot:3524605-Rhodomonas_salina.3